MHGGVHLLARARAQEHGQGAGADRGGAAAAEDAHQEQRHREEEDVGLEPRRVAHGDCPGGVRREGAVEGMR